MPDSSLSPQNRAGISYATCLANEHLSTLKPDKLLESSLTQAILELGPPSLFPQEHAINGQHNGWCPKQGLDFTNQLACPRVGVGFWGPQSMAINSLALRLPLCSDFCMSHLTRQGGAAQRQWPGELRAPWPLWPAFLRLQGETSWCPPSPQPNPWPKSLVTQ